MSTHYGRMVVLDDRVIMFANPEDAAEYIDFDLKPSARSRERGRASMYEKDGEKYFVLDTHTHFWDASPENWVKGAEEYAKGWIECFHAYQGLGPPETHWSIEDFQKYSAGALREGHVRGRPRRRGDLPADVPEGVVRERASTRPSRTPRWRPGNPDRLIVNGRFDPRDGDPGLRQLEEDHAQVRPQGREALHGRVERRLARLQALRRRSPSRSSRSASSWASPTSTSTRARRSGRWTRTPSTSPTSTRSRPATRSSTSSSSTSACRGSRTSASWRRRSATSTPASPSSSAA